MPPASDDPAAHAAADDPDRTRLVRDDGPPPARPASSNVLPEGTQLAEFIVTGVIGEGGFGIVYRARDRALQRTVAIKEYMPGALAARLADTRVVVKSEQHRETFEAGLKSFIHEARLLAQFDHPALVKVFRFWVANGTAYMAMPLYEGGTLKQALRRMTAAPDEAWLRRLLAPLLDAIELLHRADCLHRDISPDNILMAAGGTAPSPQPVLLDFGAARRVIGEQTQALTVILKPGYAPIEQYDEIPGMKQGPWTDLYALGAVLHFAITGKPPPPSVGRLVLDSWVPLSRVAAGRYRAGFLAAIDAVLAARPEARPRSVAQWRRMLDADQAPPTTRDRVAAHAAVGAQPESSPGRSESQPGPSDEAMPISASLPVANAAGAGAAAPKGPHRLLRRAATGAGAALLALGVFALWITRAAPDHDRVEAELPPTPGTSATAPAPAERAAPAPELPAARADAPPAVAPEAPAAAAPPAAPGPVVESRAMPAGEAVQQEGRRVATGTTASSPTLPEQSREPASAERRSTAGVRPATPATAAPVAPAATPAIESALREGRDCLAVRQYACTIARAEAVLRDQPENVAARALLEAARAGQEAALEGDWKMR